MFKEVLNKKGYILFDVTLAMTIFSFGLYILIPNMFSHQKSYNDIAIKDVQIAQQMKTEIENTPFDSVQSVAKTAVDKTYAFEVTVSSPNPNIKNVLINVYDTMGNKYSLPMEKVKLNTFRPVVVSDISGTETKDLGTLMNLGEYVPASGGGYSYTALYDQRYFRYYQGDGVMMPVGSATTILPNNKTGGPYGSQKIWTLSYINSSGYEYEDRDDIFRGVYAGGTMYAINLVQNVALADINKSNLKNINNTVPWRSQSYSASNNVDSLVIMPAESVISGVNIHTKQALSISVDVYKNGTWINVSPYTSYAKEKIYQIRFPMQEDVSYVRLNFTNLYGYLARPYTKYRASLYGLEIVTGTVIEL